MPQGATGTARARSSFTDQLAQFFPQAMPVRIPVTLMQVSAEGEREAESTVVEFGTSRELLFATRLPLQFADMIRVQTSDGTLDAEARVVAMQYSGGNRAAVAARFTHQVTNWIIKP